MLTPRELATMQAALLFWREEMCPHDESIMRSYLKPSNIRPLSADEIELLRAELLPANVRYARYDAATQALASMQLFPSADDALAAAVPGIEIVSVLLRNS